MLGFNISLTYQKVKWQIFILATALAFNAGGSYVHLDTCLLTKANLSSCWG